MRKVLMLTSTLLLTLPSCGLFVGGPRIATANAVGCSSLIDPEWKNGVAGAEPPSDDTVAALEIFGDAQTGKLDIANDREKATVGIIERCEARDRQAIQKVKGGVLHRIFGENDPRWLGVHLDPKRYASPG